MPNKTLLTLLLVASFQSAFAASGVQLTNTVLRDVPQKNSDGTVTVKRVVATSVAPGDKVEYQIAYRNDTPKPAEKLVVVNPIPANLEFVSASSGAEVSVDGGKAFGSLAALTVKPVAGTARAAQAADVTHVRWRIADAVAPGAMGEVSFSAKVK